MPPSPTSKRLDGSLFGAGQPCFGCSPDHPHGLKLTFEPIEGGVQAELVPTELQQGPVGVMHGGLVMTVADEVAAWAIISETGKFGFTTEMQCRLLEPVRIAKPLVARGRVTRRSSRVVRTEVEIEQDGTTCFVAQLKFVIMDKAGAEKMMGIELPDDWARFGR